MRFKRGETLKSRLWPVLLVGFGTLLILVALSGLSALRRASAGYSRISALYDAQHRTEVSLSQLRSDIQGSAVIVRDFLLDRSAPVQGFRRELMKSQQTTAAALAELGNLISAEDRPKLLHLHEDVDSYWESFDPLFRWTGAQKAGLSSGFLQREVIPRRQAVLNVVEEVQELTYDSVRKRRADIEARQAALPFYTGLIIAPTILIGLIVAAVTMVRIFELEKTATRQSDAVQTAEREMRELSRQLVQTQEEERRALSRELHDQIGQTLTAVRINLGNLEEALGNDGYSVRSQIEQTKRLAEQALRSVRDLAMGLRPAMLDDLGLEAALEWQARQHARLCGVPVTVSVEGDLADLSDAHRTCVYRIVQEALNNAAKHARAKEIRVGVRCREGSVSIAVQDDGQGFDMTRPASGLGLVGMKERVRQLDGEILIQSEPGHGTELMAEIPLAGQRI